MTARARRWLRNRRWLGASASLILVVIVAEGCRSADPVVIQGPPRPPQKDPVAARAGQVAAANPTLERPSGVASPEVGASETLPSEERERDPSSETVTITIQVEPPKRAHVFWGPKDLGLAPLEIKRPRGSGPVDLILRAPGYLTLHTRAFTDRNDRIVVRLVPETDAARTFGYRPR